MTDTKCEAQDDRTDLGMCLISETSMGDQISEARSDWLGVKELTIVGDGVSEATEWLEASRGGLPDPVHGS